MNTLKNYGFGPESITKIFESMEDTWVRSLKASTNYPPYNVKKLDENKYLIEIAVAGFDKNQLEVELKDNVLSITGHTEIEPNKDEDRHLWPQYLWRGLAARDFTRMFSVQDTIEVQNADLINGVLKIWLENLVPEKSGKKIPIGTPTTGKQLLNEDRSR
jgi:molecular chaperone IbpA